MLSGDCSPWFSRVVLLSVLASSACADTDARTAVARPGRGGQPAPNGTGAAGSVSESAATAPATNPASPIIGSPSPRASAGPSASTTAKNGCKPGVYKGSYSCDVNYNGLPLMVMGEVIFTLESKQTSVQECKPGAEFCEDLVISKNSGNLQGQAMLVLGFETRLEGALDCSTGVFRAMAVDGRCGLPVPVNSNDLNGSWHVQDPLGTFEGLLMGSHTTSASGQTIAGSWTLHEMSADVDCDGPFSVSMQP